MNVNQCLIGVAAALAVLLALGVQPGTLVVAAAALACPLMMVLMMRGMGHGPAHGDHDQTPAHDNRP